MFDFIFAEALEVIVHRSYQIPPDSGPRPSGSEYRGKVGQSSEFRGLNQISFSMDR